MRALVTGATGFIGGHVARILRSHRHDVTALVRTPAAATALEDADIAVVAGDITDPASVAAAIKGHDVVFHLAAWYAIGARDKALMERVNVEGARTVFQAAAEAGVERVVHCSTVAALGTNLDSGVGDETKQHHGRFGSLYEETKHRAHHLALEFGRNGLPTTIVMPGAVYGPLDHSMVGVLLRLWAKRLLIACPFQEAGLSWVHVEDVAAGVVAAFERGAPGESFILGGVNESIGGMFRRVAPLTRLRAPARMPAWLVRASAPLSPLIARALKQQPAMIQEGLSSLSGSWMYSSAKAERDLGYTYRSIEDGVTATINALRAE